MPATWETKVTRPKYLIHEKMSNNIDAADRVLDIAKTH